MIEREFVEHRKKEYQTQEFISASLKNVGHSHTKLKKTPLGEKIIIFTSRPGLVVGRKGQNINKLTQALKEEFNFENPQIEISEVENINMDANIVAERIASSMERFGTKSFKGIMHRTMKAVMDSGALGVEILISGKLPGSRAKRWRVFDGYLKKSGNISITDVDRATVTANLRSGAVGVQVSIMKKQNVDVEAEEGETEEKKEESAETKKEETEKKETTEKKEKVVEKKETKAPEKKEEKNEVKDGQKDKGTESSEQ